MIFSFCLFHDEIHVALDPLAPGVAHALVGDRLLLPFGLSP